MWLQAVFPWLNNIKEPIYVQTFVKIRIPHIQKQMSDTGKYIWNMTESEK